jgi:hypothetical protein
MRPILLLLSALVTTGFSHAAALLVSDAFDRVVWKVDSITGALSTFTVGGPLLAPVGLTQGPQGDIFVSDFIGDQILRYGPDGTFKGVFASTDQPTNSAFGPDGNLYVTRFLNDVVKLDGSTGAFLSEVVPTGTLQGPIGLRFGPDGNLYVTDFIGNTISRFKPDGTPLGVFISGPALDGVSVLTFAPDRTVYVSNSTAMNVLHYSAAGEFLDIFAETSPLQPFGTAIFDGGLFTGSGLEKCCVGAGEVARFDLTTKAKTVLIPVNTPGFNDVRDVLVLVPEPAAVWLTLVPGVLFLASPALRIVRQAARANSRTMGAAHGPQSGMVSMVSYASTENSRNACSSCSALISSAPSRVGPRRESKAKLSMTIAPSDRSALRSFATNAGCVSSTGA